MQHLGAALHPMEDDELWAEYHALLAMPPAEDDDGISPLPEGDYYWRLLHPDQDAAASTSSRE